MLTQPRVSSLQLYGGPGGLSAIVLPQPWLVPLEFHLPLIGPRQPDFDDPRRAPSLQLNDAGIQLIIQVLDAQGQPVDISRATAKTLKLLYPDGTTADFSAAFFADGTDGRVVYITTSSDLPQVGLCFLQAKITMGNAPKATLWGQFWVNENVDNS